jgi:hypothetical protein
LAAEVAATPARPLPYFPAVGNGLGPLVQVLPFQCRIKPVRDELLLTTSPTAQALLADVAATPKRLLLAPGLGLDTRVHTLPFQRRISVLSPLVPAAQVLLAEVAATPESSPPPAGVGLGTCVQAVPFQCAIRVLGLEMLPSLPTAQALAAAACHALADHAEINALRIVQFVWPVVFA